MSDTFLGFDIGGTKIEAVLLQTTESPSDQSLLINNKNFEVIGRERCPTERDLGYDHILGNMQKLTGSLLQTTSLQWQDIKGVGMGLPGTVHPQSGIMLNGNTLVMVNRAVGKDFAKLIGYSGPVIAANDANCFALSETLLGVGPKFAADQSLNVNDLTGVGIILGTGCGGGVVVKGQMLEGARGGASEIGHTILFDGGAPCYCGRNGCAEQYLSGPALEAQFAQRKSASNKNVFSGQEIFELYEKDDPTASAVVQSYRQSLGLFLGGLTALFDPHFFVLGGGVSRQEAIYEGLSELIAANTFLPNSETPVLSSVLGDSSGVFGAALLAIQAEFF